MARRRTAPPAGASTIQQLRQADVIRYIANNAILEGIDRASIPVNARLRYLAGHRFPDAPPHVIQAALDAAARAMERAAKQRTRGDQGRLTSKDVPAPYKGCNDWRYHLIVEWYDEETGTSGALPVPIQTSEAQTNAQLVARAANAFEAQRQRAGNYRGNYDVPAGAQIRQLRGAAQIHLLTVERVCP